MRPLLLVLGISAGAFGQNPLTQAVTAAYNNMKMNLIETAEVMPEADYGFKLSPGQRAFSEWIEHTAAGNMSFCASIRGGAPPAPHAAHAGGNKAALVQSLKQSFEFCDAAFKDMTDAKALGEQTAGDRKVYPVTGMVRLIASLNEHYGNLVGYLRSKGITPPSTARAQRGKK